MGQHGMPRTRPGRPRPSHTSPRTSSVRPPMRSRPHVLPRRKERARAQGESSAGGSASSSRRRFAISYSTTSGCGTTSAGRCSTAESTPGRQHCTTSASVSAWARPTAWRATARMSSPRPTATSHSRRCTAAGGAGHTPPVVVDHALFHVSRPAHRRNTVRPAAPRRRLPAGTGGRWRRRGRCAPRR